MQPSAHLVSGVVVAPAATLPSAAGRVERCEELLHREPRCREKRGETEGREQRDEVRLEREILSLLVSFRYLTNFTCDKVVKSGYENMRYSDRD